MESESDSLLFTKNRAPDIGQCIKALLKNLIWAVNNLIWAVKMLILAVKKYILAVKN